MNNSEMLYLYDAKMTNPNGDPDDENRPRMDGDRDVNIVTDVRLKRYIRDYFESKEENSIYVRKINDQPVMPGKVLDIDSVKTKDEILKKYRDVRLFGATVAVEKQSLAITGPAQFNWGYSLNKVEIIEAGITTHFASNEKATQSSMGRDYRVRYSFLAFSGALSGLRAEKTTLSNEDVSLMDEAMLHAIPQQFTRSKIGQTPRLYLRLEYKDTETYFGDLRRFVKLKKTEDLRDIEEVVLDVSKLKEFLDNENVRSRIDKVYGFCCNELYLIAGGEPVSFEQVLSGLPFKEV